MRNFLINIAKRIGKRRFKILWSSKEKAGTWIAIEKGHGRKPLYIHFNRPGYSRQWFAYISIFPLYLSKNNSSLEIGINLILVSFSLIFHLNFHPKGLYVPRRNPIRIDFL